MLAKNLMALGKLCLILACSNANAQSWGQPLYNNWVRGESASALIYNITVHFSSKLNKEDREIHARAVYHALDNLDNGEVVEWFNDKNGSRGVVKIAYSWSASGLVYRRIYSWVQYGQYQRTFEDTAYQPAHTRTWNFIDKY